MLAPSEEKSDDSKDGFMRKLSRFLILIQKWRKRIFSILQSGMRIYVGLVMIMGIGK